MGGKRLPYVVGPSGDSWALQASIWRNKRLEFHVTGNGTGVTTVGFGNTSTGTATARNVATTNFYTAARRIGYVSAGTAGSSVRATRSRSSSAAMVRPASAASSTRAVSAFRMPLRWQMRACSSACIRPPP
jgi:hypothetical protein